MRRLAPSSLLALLLLAVVALPAFAHASLDKKQVPAETEVELSLRVPIEVASDNQRIRTLVPGAFEVVTCSGPAGWACEVDGTSNAPDHVVAWTSDDGTADERFSLTLRTPSADEQGVYLLPTVQTYADGTEARWIQEETGGDRPAPRLQIGDANAEIVNNDAATAHGEPTASPASERPSPTDRPTSQPTRTLRSEATDEPTAPADTDPGDETGSDSLLFAGIVVGLLAIAGVGLLFGRHRAGR